MTEALVTPLPPSDSTRRSSSPLSTTMSEGTEGSLVSYPSSTAGAGGKSRKDKGDKVRAHGPGASPPPPAFVTRHSPHIQGMTSNKENMDIDTAQQQHKQHQGLTIGQVLGRIQSVCPDSDEDGDGDTTDDEELRLASLLERAKRLKNKGRSALEDGDTIDHAQLRRIELLQQLKEKKEQQQKGRSAVEAYVTSDKEEDEDAHNSDDDGDIDLDVESVDFEPCSDNDDEEMSLDGLDNNDEDEDEDDEDSEMDVCCFCGDCDGASSCQEDDSERSHDSDEESNLDSELSEEEEPKVINKPVTASKSTPEPTVQSVLGAFSSRGSKSSTSSAPTPKAVTPPEDEGWWPAKGYKKPNSSAPRQTIKLSVSRPDDVEWWPSKMSKKPNSSAPRPTVKSSAGVVEGGLSSPLSSGPDWKCYLCMATNGPEKEMCFICEAPRPMAAIPRLGRREGAPKSSEMPPTPSSLTGLQNIALPSFTTPMVLPRLDSIALPTFTTLTRHASLNKGTASPKTASPPTVALATPTSNDGNLRPEEDKGSKAGSGTVSVKKSAPPSSSNSRKGSMDKPSTLVNASAPRSLLQLTVERHNNLFNTPKSTAPAPPTNTQTPASSQPPKTHTQTQTQRHQSTDDDCHCNICLRDKSPDNITIPNLPRLRIFEELTEGIDSNFDDLMHQQIGDGLKRRREVIVKDIDRARAKRMKKEKKANKHINEADAKVQTETDKVEAARAALNEAEKELDVARNVRLAAVAELTELRNSALVIGDQSAADIIAAHNEQVGKFAAGFGWDETMA